MRLNKIEKNGKKTMTSSLEQMINDYHNGVYDFTDNGECVKCGNCCTNFLPMSDKEIKVIKRYIKKHKIKENIHILPINEYYDATCPFLKDKQCVIYEVRPFICQVFKCDKYIPRDKIRKKLNVINVRKEFYEGIH